MMDPEAVLDVMGCKTRRQILTLLTEEPRFVSQISRELDVGQKAIIEHLRAMEELGIIRSSFRKIERGRPRKYYDISRDIKIQIFISNNNLKTELADEIFSKIQDEPSEMCKIEDKIQNGRKEEGIEDLELLIERYDKRIKQAQMILNQLKKM